MALALRDLQKSIPAGAMAIKTMTEKKRLAAAISDLTPTVTIESD